MNPRQAELFRQIVRVYLTTAEPVGSLFLAKKGGRGLSSATIRNEMMELESAGYIYQPHTSAGRVPTEKGYKYYVDNFLGASQPATVLKKQILQSVRRLTGEEKIKGLARAISETTEEAVIVAFNQHQLYFTGLSFLFSKPEFCEQARVASISQVLDHFEEAMPAVLELVGKEKIALVGGQNPFGQVCSFIAAPLRLRQRGQEGFFGILGPLRMDYEKNWGLVDLIKEIL